MKLLLRKRIQDEITNTYDIISDIILVVIDSQKASKPNWIMLMIQNVHPAFNNRPVPDFGCPVPCLGKIFSLSQDNDGTKESSETDLSWPLISK